MIVHILEMTYLVEIVEEQSEDTSDTGAGMPLYTLQRRFSRLSLAEDAGRIEVERLGRIGRRVLYRILILERREASPCGPVQS
jgi:hypothetical protein